MASPTVVRQREFFGEGFDAGDRSAEVAGVGKGLSEVKWIQDQVD
jgi:hypothetical protein